MKSFRQCHFICICFDCSFPLPEEFDSLSVAGTLFNPLPWNTFLLLTRYRQCCGRLNFKICKKQARHFPKNTKLVMFEGIPTHTTFAINSAANVLYFQRTLAIFKVLVKFNRTTDVQFLSIKGSRIR